MYSKSLFSAVTNGTRCALACEDGYFPFHLGLRQEHQCEDDEWTNQERIDLVCQYNSKLMESPFKTLI